MQLNYIIDTCKEGYRYDIESDTFVPDEEDIKLDRKVRVQRLMGKAINFIEKHQEEVKYAVSEYHRQLGEEFRKRNSGK